MNTVKRYYFWGVMMLFWTNACVEDDSPKNKTPIQELQTHHQNTNPILKEYDSLHPCLTSKKFIKRYQKWQNTSFQKDYAGFTVILTEQVCKAEQSRERFPYPSEISTYWQKVYGNLVNVDYKELQRIYEMFERIGKQKKLNYVEFVEMVMGFIQNIPYVLVHPDDCDTDARNNNFSNLYHSQGKECLPNKKFGLQSPSEFMFNFKGDCDTRAVFAYTVLTYFGYDVVVLGSERHAMLGINLPGTGNYLIERGRRYYFWETTAKGWLIGAIPPEYQNDNWNITLKSLKQAN